MAQSREVEYYTDFSGGLKLSAVASEARENESPDCCNVDFGSTGGFRLRGGFVTVDNDTMMDGASFICHGDNETILIVDEDGDLFEFGGTITNTGDHITDVPGEAVEGILIGRTVYFANTWAGASLASYKYVSGGLVGLGNVFNDDYNAPTGGNMPLSRHIAFANEYTFVGDTTESGTRYPTRVRYSHTGSSEDWATEDWFPVEGAGTGDPITGIVPFEDGLFIFKRSSVWTLFGNDSTQWVLEQVAGVGGAASLAAVAVAPGSMYWYTPSGQLMAWRSGKIYTLGKNIQFWADSGRINAGGDHKLLWSDERLWLSLEAGSADARTRHLFIYNPLSYNFTLYDREVTSMIQWVQAGENDLTLVLCNESESIYRFDESSPVDVEPSGPATISGYLRTAWFTGGETATRKRWKRPRVTAAADGNAVLRLRVYRDYDRLTVAREEVFDVFGTTTTSVWGTMQWGDPWATPVDGTYTFSRLGSSGTGRAIQYQFSSDSNLGRWWIDSLAVPFRRKAVK